MKTTCLLALVAAAASLDCPQGAGDSPATSACPATSKACYSTEISGAKTASCYPGDLDACKAAAKLVTDMGGTAACTSGAAKYGLSATMAVIVMGLSYKNV